MATYTVTIYESATHTVVVEAPNADDAQSIASDQYLAAGDESSVDGVTEYLVKVDDLIFEVDGDDEDDEDEDDDSE